MTTKRIFILILVIFSCAVLAFGQSGMLKRIVSKTDKLDFGAGGTVSIMGAPKGNIRIEPSERSEIDIDAEITLEATSEADLATLEKVTGFILEESLGAEVITSVGTHDAKYLKRIDKKFPKQLIGLPFSIDYVIKVPRYCDLRIENGTGDITVSGIEGALNINSLNGNTKLDLVSGGVTATFGKGYVFVTMPNRSWRGNAIDIALS